VRKDRSLYLREMEGVLDAFVDGTQGGELEGLLGLVLGDGGAAAGAAQTGVFGQSGGLSCGGRYLWLGGHSAERYKIIG
jgi:hypothetical protein